MSRWVIRVSDDHSVVMLVCACVACEYHVVCMHAVWNLVLMLTYVHGWAGKFSNLFIFQSYQLLQFGILLKPIFQTYRHIYISHSYIYIHHLHPLTHSLAHSLTHSHTHTHTHNKDSPRHTHTQHTHPDTDTDTDTHTHTHTHTHTQSMYCMHTDICTVHESIDSKTYAI